MKKMQDELRILQQVATLIAKQFGIKCEVVIHDLTQNYDHTIIDIRNGHVTNREIGGCGSNLGLEVLSGNVIDGDRFNYVTTTSDGRILRSSSIYIKNDEGEVIGSICINFDITETVQFEGFLRQFNHYEVEQEEVFVKDVNNLLEFLIQEGQSKIGKPVENMTKEDKIEFIGCLDKKGAFLITKSGDRICDFLQISKFTLYNYLEVVRRRGENR